MADSHTGNHPEDDFMPLETIRRCYSVIRKRISFELEGETFKPERGDPILYLAGLKTLWKYSPKRPIIYYQGQEIDFKSFRIQGVNGEFNFLLERGFDDNQGSLSAKSMNNETPIIDEEPISTVLPSNVADNIIDSSNTSSDDELPLVHPFISSFPEVGKKSKDAGKRKLVVDALREGSHHKARKAPVQVSKVAGDASTPSDVDSDLDIYGKFEHVYKGQVNGLHNEYGRLLLEERKWANYEQTLSILHAKEIDSLRRDKAAIVSKVVPNAAMKLVHSDEMGVLVARLVRVAIIHGRCTAFEEVAKLKEPFILEKMPGYRTSLKDEYDRAREDMANASYPFFSEFTLNPNASVE
ncbi:hypothetical protein Tco_0016192 [Tanacetum coccineum]